MTNKITILILMLLALGFNSCTNLDEVNKRLDEIELQVNALQQAYNNGYHIEKIENLSDSDGWLITFSDQSTVTIENSVLKDVTIEEEFVIFEMSDGKLLRFKLSPFSEAMPKLLKMALKASDNAENLIIDAECTIIGDSIVECWIPNVTSNKNLIPSFEYEGDGIMIDGMQYENSKVVDFKKPVNLEVKLNENSKQYTVYVHSFNGLPVLWIETENRAEIKSKEEYLNAHFKLVEDVTKRSAGDIIEVEGTIKGRGNSTWTLPKKPYALKFNDKVSFLDEPKDKSWVLLANYTDKTMLRNATAFYMGKISNLEYTPQFHYVDVFLNGMYNGTYQLGDKLKISKNRVNVGDDGFLMEIDKRASSEADARWFNVPHIGNPINIKDPDVEYDDENFSYAKEFVMKADEALFSDKFDDTDEGWQKYMDMDSFVDWYLINEITKNNDAIFFSSCYMNLKRGEKLKMGPLWDFDISIGNINYNGCYIESGFWIKNVAWYSQLFKDKAFVARVKERFDYFYSHKDEIMAEINQNAEYLKLSVQENENKWHTFYNSTWPQYNVWGSYMNEVQYMKQWLSTRLEWLKKEFESL